jgi:hypothetical protein
MFFDFLLVTLSFAADRDFSVLTVQCKAFIIVNLCGLD